MRNKWRLSRIAILKILIFQVAVFGTFYGKDNARAVQPDQVIQGWGNKCLDVVNNEGKGPRNGTPVVIWDCYGSENQKWKLNSNGTIQGWGNKCLDVANGEAKTNATDGMQIVIWDCHGAANQRWKLNSDGTIIGWDGKCLDVANPEAQKDPTSGMFVVLWHCHGAGNQLWQVSTYVAQCINAKIRTNIQQLSQKGREDKVEDIFESLVRCNSQAVPELVRILRSQDKDVGMVAIAVLGSIGTNASPAVEPLITSFRDSDIDVRFTSAVALGYIGGSAKRAVPMLSEAIFKDRSEDVRSRAASAAAALSNAIVPQLIQSLKSPETEKRLRAVEALGNIGSPASGALSLLRNIASRDRDSKIRASANTAVSKISGEISRPRKIIPARQAVMSAVYAPPRKIVLAPRKYWICVIPFLNAAPKCRGK